MEIERMFTPGEIRTEFEEDQTDDMSYINSIDEDMDLAERKQNNQCGKEAGISKILRLPWVVSDFDGITTSVYEAVMIAALRARQIGKRQKAEIDAWNASIELSEMTPEEEDAEEPGIDHFNHSKPTVKALYELKEQTVDYRYPDESEK